MHYKERLCSLQHPVSGASTSATNAWRVRALSDRVYTGPWHELPASNVLGNPLAAKGVIVTTSSGRRMDGVDPGCLLRRLRRLYIEVDDDRLLIITHDDAGERFVTAGINLLVGNERWYVDEVARPGLGNEFQAFSPPHPRTATYHIDHTLQFSVVMRTGFSVRGYRDGTRPQLICSNCGMGNSRRTRHSRCLRGIKV